MDKHIYTPNSTDNLHAQTQLPSLVLTPNSRGLRSVCVEHVVGSKQVQLPTALFKHVSPSQPLGRVHQCLLHAGWIDVAMVDGTYQ